jgi:uncharacterized membrane protein
MARRKLRKQKKVASNKAYSKKLKGTKIAKGAARRKALGQAAAQASLVQAPATSLLPVPVSKFEPVLNDEQILQMLDLGKKCYSLFGQTRWFWMHLAPPISYHKWLRFHFLQASMLSWFFISIYLLLALLGILSLSAIPEIAFGFVAAAFVAVLIAHILLFAYLGWKAGDGKVPKVPFFGPRAAKLAVSDMPLGNLKI